MSYPKTSFFFLFAMALISLNACKNAKDKNFTDEDGAHPDVSATETERNEEDVESVGKFPTEVSATVTLENGQTKDLRGHIIVGSENMGTVMILFGNTKNPNMGLITLTLPSGAPEGTYSGTIKLFSSEFLKEQYLSSNKGGSSDKKGNAEIIVTEIGNDHIQGTFSATLYSGSGKKAIISKGKLDGELNI